MALDSGRGDADPCLKIARTGVSRESGYLYFLDGAGDVARSRLRRGRQPGPARTIVRVGLLRDPAMLYFIDRDGDVACVPKAGPVGA